MSTMVSELYEALRKAGVDEQHARDAAEAVLPADARVDLATNADVVALKADVVALKVELKADLLALRTEFKADLAETKTELIKWNVGAMAVLTGIFAAIVRLG